MLKVGLGTIENGLATSDFPPEGPKKGRCVEKDTFQKIENKTSGPPDSNRGHPISPQRVRKKRVKSNLLGPKKVA